MLNCCKSSTEKQQTAVDKEINKSLQDAGQERSSKMRLLLLGAGESGKSTIVKQMRIIHAQDFSQEERESAKSNIHQNIYLAAQALLRATETLNVPIEDKQVLAVKNSFNNPEIQMLTPELVKEIEIVWKDKSIQAVYARRHEFQLVDSAQYLLDRVSEIGSAEYVPTPSDILRCRVKTTGIIETHFEIDGTPMTLVDVGGQRSERKKWMHCFEDVNAVLFCAALSDFNQTLYEDGKTNRMHESLKLFHEICTSKWFSSTTIMLFLNKSDLFQQKLDQGHSITAAFPDYRGEDKFEASVEFIKQKFCNVLDPVSKRPKDIFTHVTCATDTKNVQLVFVEVKKSVIDAALKHSL